MPSPWRQKRLMISSTVIPLGADLSSGPSCARASVGIKTMTNRRGSRALNRAVTESEGSLKNAGRNWDLINPILTKGSTEELTAASTPRAAVHTALRRGWKTAVLPISFDAAGGGRFAGFTFLYFHGLSLSLRAFGMALAIPHSTNPGNNW